MVFGDKIRLTRTIRTILGSRSLEIEDVAENFGYRPSPFTILYHLNFGFPLLDESTRLSLSAEQTEPVDAQSQRGMDGWSTFSAPVAGFAEENYLHTMKADKSGSATAVLVNPRLVCNPRPDDNDNRCQRGLGVYIRFDPMALPYLNEWKLMDQGDYVVAIEPCNAPCANRAELRKLGLLPSLEAGEKWSSRLEIGVLEGLDEIERFLEDAGLWTEDRYNDR